MKPIYECGHEQCPGTKSPHHSTKCPRPPTCNPFCGRPECPGDAQHGHDLEIDPPTRACRYCVAGLVDSYEVDGAGRCVVCLDTRIETVTSCEGCGEEAGPDRAVRSLTRYVVEFHDYETDGNVYYCADCAALAKADWNGETKSIQPWSPTCP